MGFQFEQHRLGLGDLSWDLKKTISWEMGLGPPPPPLHDPLRSVRISGLKSSNTDHLHAMMSSRLTGLKWYRYQQRKTTTNYDHHGQSWTKVVGTVELDHVSPSSRNACWKMSRFFDKRENHLIVIILSRGRGEFASRPNFLSGIDATCVTMLHPESSPI